MDIMATFPRRAVEAKPRHIIGVVKRAWLSKVSSVDLGQFTTNAWTGYRQSRMLETPLNDVPDAAAERAAQLCQETAAQLCLLSSQKCQEEFAFRVFHAWNQIVIESRAQTWCDTVRQEKDEIKQELSRAEESNKQMRAQVRAVDRFRERSEKELQTANIALKRLWQELHSKATALTASKEANERLLQELSDVKKQLSESSSVASAFREENAMAKCEVSRLEAQLAKLQAVCVVCMAKLAVIAFAPCGHLATCEVCAPRLSSRECPICRELIVQELHVFIP